MIAGLILLLQIPIVLIAGLVGERQDRRNEAAAEIAGKWGSEQRIVGPWMAVPFEQRVTEVDPEGKSREVSRTGSIMIAPRDLTIDGSLDVQTRSRGIFEVPVYRSSLHFEGYFDIDDASIIDAALPPGARPDWNQAQLVVFVADTRTIQGGATLHWGNRELEFSPGAGYVDPGRGGIHVPLGSVLASRSHDFAFDLSLDGSGAMHIAPVGDETRIHAASSWDSPSFQGSWLPTQRSVNAEGFEATWTLSALSRGYASTWQYTAEARALVDDHMVSVALLTPVDHYRMSERSVKYELLFLVLVFAIVWLFEVKASIPVHPIQYLFVGLSSCTFYLLELALSEHLGFTWAYVVAATMVVSMLGMYGAAVLRRGWRGVLLSGACAALYAYLYVVLLNEDYALLAGALAVFGSLAVVMALTHRIDWNSNEPEGQEHCQAGDTQRDRPSTPQ